MSYLPFLYRPGSLFFFWSSGERGEAKDGGWLGVHDATELVNKPALQQGTFTKAFSNAAMHWILRPEDKREPFFRGVREALTPGGTFAFEMGGLGNVSEMVAGILGPVGRRIGLDRAWAISPWFFPDEALGAPHDGGASRRVGGRAHRARVAAHGG